jgi:hypothetical protein
VNFDSLTVAEIIDLEDISGQALATIDADKPIGRVLQGLVYIMSRRAGTPRTLDEIAQMPMGEANKIIAPLVDEGGAPDPE